MIVDILRRSPQAELENIDDVLAPINFFRNNSRRK